MGWECSFNICYRGIPPHTNTLLYIMVLGTYRGLIWNVALGTQVAPMKRDIRDLWYFNESSACTVCMKRQPTRLQLLKTFTSTALLFSERVKSNLFTEPELPVTHFNLQIELLTMLLPCILGRLYTYKLYCVKTLEFAG